MYKGSQNNVIGDPNEGKLIIHEAIFACPELDDKPQKIEDVAMATASENDYVFCMFGINPKNQKTFAFTEDQKENFSKEYDTALLITDVYEFSRRVLKAAQDMNLEIEGDFVRYYNPLSDDIRRLIDLLQNGMRKIAFYKVDDYAYQQEYRFTVPYIAGKDHIEVDMKSISDISEICSTQEILSSHTIAAGSMC